MNVLYSLWAVYLFIGLGVTADAFFVPTLTRISGIFLHKPYMMGYTVFEAGDAFDPHWIVLTVGEMIEVRLFEEKLER